MHSPQLFRLFQYLPESTPTERHTVMPVHDRCSRFLAIMREVFPQLQNPQFFICQPDGWLILHARAGRVNLCAKGTNHNKTMHDFMHKCLTKLTAKT